MASRGQRETIGVDELLGDFSPPRVAIVERLRTLVLDVAPDAIERVRPGWRLIGYDLPKRRGTSFFAWIWPQPEHVHLGFPLGITMTDREGWMEGSGVTKQARWLTYDTLDDVDEVVARTLLHEAIRGAGMSHEERHALLVDRDVGG